MSLALRRLFLLNPILEEATRAWRKFFRVAGGPGKGLSYTIVFIVALIYAWLLLEIVESKGGGSTITTILFLQLVLVTLIMPISVYGAISGERERTTWDALILTRLTPGQIVVGKILWRLGGLLILMILFLLPLVIGMNYGNEQTYDMTNRATWSGIWTAEAMTLAWGLGLCSYGLWVSANTRRSVTSGALIFISLLAVLALLPILMSMIGGEGWNQGDFAGNYASWILMHINAFYALGKVTTWYDSSSGGQGPDPLFGREWGVLQIGIYLAGAAIFLYASYRTLKLWEEHKNRLG